jgi:NAD-dependent SIR2 family protein deacetylase
VLLLNTHLLQGVTLVLGSSLQIVPANEIPLYTPVNGGKMVIVNLQVSLRCRFWTWTEE